MSVIDLAANPSDLRALAEQSNAWPFEQAKAIVARLKKSPKDEVLFETGYGPSGLPHIGTFGEVARTSMVRHAFRVLTEDKIKTRLLAFSDDMDGLRKVPDNVANKAPLEANLGKPLTRVPDPFGTHDSFGAHNNARLRAFLDHFGFDYEFASSTDYYTSGRFDATLLKMLAAYDKVMAIILPTLGPDRRATYSPFLPISKTTGIVLQVPMIRRDVAAGTITYVDPDTNQEVETPVTGGNVKCQWKADWAMRWVALGVDYEMAGKDLIDSVKLSGAIARALGGTPPEGFNYELFLDDKGQKISKSKGNGLTIDEWLRYASPESLSLFMYHQPKAAKRLHFDVIPRNMDDYQQFLEGFPKQDAKQQLGNPVWHIHYGHPPKADMPVTFQLLLTLVSSSNAENAETLWGFIGRYRPGVTAKTHPKLDAMVGYAINYYRDFVAPTKKFRSPTASERAALQDLRDALSSLPSNASGEDIQNMVYDIGRREPFLDQVKKGKDGRPGVTLDWFNMLYQVLLGQEKGPRFGSFVAVYGVQNAMNMIDGALARSATEELVVPISIEEIIRRLDASDAPISVLAVSEEVNKSRQSLKDPSQSESLGAWAEALAFALSPHKARSNPWNTYFGPMASLVDKDGKTHYVPDIAGTPGQVIDHWMRRASSVAHPVLKARYADLVWDLAYPLAKRRRDPIAAATAIDAYLASATAQFRPEAYYRYDAVERALDLAISLRDAQRTEQVRNVFMQMHREEKKDQKGAWWRAFDRLFFEKNANLSDSEKTELLGDLESIVSIHSDAASPQFDPHSTEAAARRLISAYSRDHRSGDVNRLHEVVAHAFERFANMSSPMLAAALLQTALDAYQRAGLTADSKRVRVEMERKIGESKAEMRPIESEVTIKKDDVEKFVSGVIADDLSSSFARLANEFLPRRKMFEDTVEKIAEEAPLMALLSQQIMSDDRVTAVIGSVEEDSFGRLFEQAKSTYSFFYIWLFEAFRRLTDKHNVLPEHVVGWANRHGLYDDTGLLLQGVRAWFDGDFVKSVHVLVPQIERGVRSISGKLGKPVTKAHPRVKGASVATNLGDILYSSDVTDKLGPDLTFYLLSLYADPRGFNLRNELAHGQLELSSMTDHLARLVIHTLLVLGVWKELAESRRERKATGDDEGSTHHSA